MEKNEEIRGDITDLEMSPQAAGAEDPPLAAGRLRNLLISLDLRYLLVF